MKEELELRMYSMCLYQLSGMAAGIQSGHSNVEYGVINGMEKGGLFYEWATKWKTVIVLNGGTSGMMLDSLNTLRALEVNHAAFREPDLYDQITSISFVVDERVFNNKKHPDFKDFVYENDWITYNDHETLLKEFKYELNAQEIKHGSSSSLYYLRDEWIESLGGEYNVRLREWLRGFRLHS